MSEAPDVTRLRLEYASRRQRFASTDRYSRFNPANLFTLQQRQRTVLPLLRREGFYPLKEIRILEVGCGTGGVLLELLSYDTCPAQLHGCDLLPDRLDEAHTLLPHLALVNADGQSLPYAAHSFDLAMTFTVFSSILDDEIKTNVARELLRVARPDGMIFWYDFWLNPTNPQTRGIRPVEIRHLFPNCTYEFHKITLAPPLARRIVPISWSLALLLESLKIFNTYYLAAIRPKIQS